MNDPPAEGRPSAGDALTAGEPSDRKFAHHNQPLSGLVEPGFKPKWSGGTGLQVERLGSHLSDMPRLDEDAHPLPTWAPTLGRGPPLNTT